MTGFPINPPRAKLVNDDGSCTPEWYRFFLAIQKLIGGADDPFDQSSMLGAATALPGDAPQAQWPVYFDVPGQADVWPPPGDAQAPVQVFMPPLRTPGKLTVTSPLTGGGDMEGNVTVGLGTTLDSGTYTPTLTNDANLDSSVAFACQYLRVGSVVTVSGRVTVDPTAPATSTTLRISLPIASNLGVKQDCCGAAASPGVAGQSAAIVGDVTNDAASMIFIAGDVTAQAMYFTFTYRII